MVLALHMFFLSFYSSGVYLKFPHMLGTQPPAVFLLGPAIYFFARSVADAWKPTAIHLLHFVPVAIAAAAYADVYVLSAEIKYQTMSNWTWRAEDFGWRYYINQAGAIQNCVYYAVSLGVLYRSGMQSRLGFLLLLTVIPTGFFFTYGAWIADLKIQEIGFVFLELHLLAFYLLISRERSWLDRLTLAHRGGDTPANMAGDEKAGNPAHYSRLGKIDQNEVLKRLEAMMVDEQIFADEDLNIQRLADLLGLKRHQLSELLNHVVGSDFKSFLNQYRVAEAGRLLVQEPERSVISIAFAVGFNSKSAFHQVFRKMTGLTPTEYRQRETMVTS